VTNVQLYLAVGMPTLAILAGILINGMQFAALRGEMQSLSARLTSVGTRLDMLLAKVMDIDNRLTRLEARMERM